MAGNQFMSIIGWWFLPTVVGYIQNFLYALFIRAGDPKPQPGSPKYIKHRKTLHTLVIALYLFYTVYEADWELRRASDFYQALGVPADVSEKTLQSRFRRLTILHHPDKIASAEARPAAEAYYVYLKQARDTLVDPAKRFAYDRFGPDILEWKHCVTIRDYVLHGILTSAPSYIAGGLVMILLGMLGYMEWGRYWRYLAFAAMLVFEAHTITRPDFPAIATKVFNPVFAALHIHPPLLPYQTLVIARKITFASFIAMQQLAPLLQNPQRNLQTQNSLAAQHEQLNRLTALTRTADQDAMRLIGLETIPFSGEEGENELRGKMKNWLVQHTIKSDPVVRDALGRAVQKRRQGAPAGARGTT